MKKPIRITVDAEENLHPYIEEFNNIGGIYENINSGILQEPWIPIYLTKLMGYPVIKIGGIIYAGSDFIAPSTGELIEHKSAVIQDKIAEIEGVGEIKRQSHYISIYVRTTYILYLIPTIIILDDCDIRNMGNCKALPFRTNMIPDHKNNRVNNNTKILIEHARWINLETGEIKI